MLCRRCWLHATFLCSKSRWCLRRPVAGMISLFVLGPILDVWFSRRSYATVLVALSALCLTTSVIFQRRVVVLETIMILGFACSTLSQNALGGWLASIVPKKDESNLSAWAQAASVGAGGISTIVAGESCADFQYGSER